MATPIKRITYRELAERFGVDQRDVQQAVFACRTAGLLDIYIGGDGRTREIDADKVEDVRNALIRMGKTPTESNKK